MNTTGMSSRSGKFRSSLTGLLLAAPAIIGVILFQLIPIIYTIRLSTAKPGGFKLQGFVGFENFISLFKSKKFFNLSEFPSSLPSGAIATSIEWIIIGVPLVILIGLVVALVADKSKFQSVIRGAFFLPMVISGTVLGIIWLFVYTPNPNIGLLNALLHSKIAWLGDPKLVNISLIVAWVWSQVGMSVIIIAAALKGVPEELLDAAKVDGANAWQRFIHITLPAIKIPMSFLLITQMIQVLKVFDIVFVMTGGGPGGVSRTLAVMFYEQSFTFLRPQFGATVVIVMTIIAIAVYKLVGNVGKEKEV